MSKGTMQIVGRYMDGTSVVGYHVQDLEKCTGRRYTKEQVIYLIGRGIINNCEAQIYQDKVLLRGKGMRLEDLPVQQSDGSLSRTQNIGKVRKGTSAAAAMEQFMIVAYVVDGDRDAGFAIRNSAGHVKHIDRESALKLAKAGRIGNARYQEYNGRRILRSVGETRLHDLPHIPISQFKQARA